MAFDDLARHMAGRDKRKMVKGDAAQIVEDAEVADRRTNRQTDLILGSILLVGAVGLGALIVKLNIDVFEYAFGTAKPQDQGTQSFTYPLAYTVIPLGMLIVGIQKLFRGLRTPAA